MTTATNVFSSNLIFPLYCKYPQQHQPQSAYIELDLESGAITADYSGEIGNAVPGRVWHGIDIRWSINPELTTDQISSLINDNIEYFQTILDGSGVVWDGSNWVGKLDSEVDFERFIGVEPAGGIIDSFSDWIYDHRFPSAGQSLDEYIAEVHSCDGSDGYYFSDRESSVEDVREMLMDFWSEYLYSGNELPKNVALALIADGRCDDSAWIEELREFAAR